jgi:hypothetical protein
MSSSTDHSAEWISIATTFAYGLLVCVATVSIAYIVLRTWPRRHHPRFFSLLAGTATVAVLYVFQVPGAGFALVVLVLVAWGTAASDWFEQKDDGPKGKTVPKEVQVERGSTVLSVLLGVLIGVVLTMSAVAAMIMPPAYVLRWASATEPLNERIERALNPGDQWSALRAKERDESDRLTRSEAELASANKRVADAETALAKARDELGAATSNTVRGIKIKEHEGSRHANGAIYIGVSGAFGYHCIAHASSDKVDDIAKDLHAGEAISLLSSRGKYRVVLIAADSSSCTFDLVKD